MDILELSIEGGGRENGESGTCLLNVCRLFSKSFKNVWVFHVAVFVTQIKLFLHAISFIMSFSLVNNKNTHCIKISTTSG